MKQYKWTYEDDIDCYNDISEEAKTILRTWIYINIKPRKTPNNYHTSYGLKHIFQRDTGIYVYNGCFKAAMLECGFQPVTEDEQNWHYNISEKSPAFSRGWL